MTQKPDDVEDLMKSRIPLDNQSPEDVIIIVFLSSNLSDYITGETYVNGGMYFIDKIDKIFINKLTIRNKMSDYISSKVKIVADHLGIDEAK